MRYLFITLVLTGLIVNTQLDDAIDETAEDITGKYKRVEISTWPGGK